MAWLLIIAAGVLEVVWLMGLKYSAGFTKLVPSAVTVAALVASMILASQALKALPVGTAYVVWTGIGAAGAAIAGIILFGESRDLFRLASIGLILAGIVGLKMTTQH